MLYMESRLSLDEIHEDAEILGEILREKTLAFK